MIDIIGWAFIIMVIVFLLGTMYSIANNIVFRSIDDYDENDVFEEE